MIKTSLTEEKALQDFNKGIDCSQAVFGEFSEYLGLDRQTALKIAAPFGGGMRHGETCGCVTGALMVIGLKYGQGDVCNLEAKNHMRAVQDRFEAAFTEKYGSCICKEILGYDLSKPAEREKVMQENLFEEVCCKAVIDSCIILEDILND
ncbi:MAG TPA: C_GCAxxG_C_C family protein [Clostridiales bacterium]|jgi:C_GCAxxG_C_C family probable redox protein|nr:C_GCAxxG_C_C family protein [Clostridiales bacterium]